MGYSVFSGCSSLNTITLSASLTEISKGAFADCVKLQSIILPDRVVSISTDAFYGCAQLKVVSVPRSLYSVADNAFAGCEALARVDYDGNSADFAKISFGKGNDTFKNMLGGSIR